MHGHRRQGRTYALQLLYQLEQNPEPVDAAKDRFWRGSHASGRAREFGTMLVEQTMAHREAIDAALNASLQRWKLQRLPAVVRNVLRLSYCEMLIVADVPFQVVVNEAVELTRAFMDEESARFVNSVLEKCWRAARGDDSPPAQ